MDCEMDPAMVERYLLFPAPSLSGRWSEWDSQLEMGLGSACLLVSWTAEYNLESALR